MSNEEINPLNIIKEANSKTFHYFNEAYVNSLELAQNLKSELLELEVQIETLEKTKELYAYHTDNRRGIFSPLSEEDDQTITKGKQIALQINDLEGTREHLKKRISDLEKDILFYKEQVELLSKAEKCIPMVENYACLQYAECLEQKVKQELISNLNKLDDLKWLLHSDTDRAKVTLDELHASHKSILDSLDTILKHINN